ncbi:MAG: DUF4845 domain-containing protein [Spongiibacter sp.]|uniref:DUF4845 domain-containing protein n=1 Tax=Spongiibacter thalassae TaxID=2721624 RepID=A0ABX1GD33_9GAMM|nr:DUF4845 domain-containing protein [Spongiibacter thalassae]MDX1505531.1 DUF4845 domain-containing protein [Spongiibacter sp.]NKI17090.1 DUF4845 domain-containing protein [Spongiibacter thalassae]
MRRSQQGLGMLSLLVVLGMASVILTMAVKLVPLYMDNWSLKSVLESVVADQTGVNATPGSVRTTLSRYMQTNRIDAISPAKMLIKSESNGVSIDASYEKRVTLFFNIDAVVKFDDMVYKVPR